MRIIGKRSDDVMIPDQYETEQCPYCHNQIDPETCHCGSGMNGHPYQLEHNFVPMGCICGYSKQ